MTGRQTDIYNYRVVSLLKGTYQNEEEKNNDISKTKHHWALYYTYRIVSLLKDK